MNKANFSLVYFLTRPLFLGGIFAPVIRLTGNDAILSFALGIILGALIIFIFNKAELNSKFYNFLKITLYICFIIVSSYTLELFINNFFLLATPKLLIIYTSIILCLYASFKDINIIKYVSFLLFIIGFPITCVTFLSFANIANFSNLLPLFTTDALSIMKGAIIFGVLSSVPNILLKEEEIPLKSHLKYYLFSSFICFIIGLIILIVLSPELAGIYRSPEYIVLKKIKLFNFIENMENIICTVWYLDYFIFLTLTFKRLYTSVNKNKVIFYPIVLITPLLTTFLMVKKYYPVLIVFKYLGYIFGVFVIIIAFSAIKKLFISSERHK